MFAAVGPSSAPSPLDEQLDGGSLDVSWVTQSKPTHSSLEFSRRVADQVSSFTGQA